jgi:hypothetical protein
MRSWLRRRLRTLHVFNTSVSFVSSGRYRQRLRSGVCAWAYHGAVYGRRRRDVEIERYRLRP